MRGFSRGFCSFTLTALAVLCANAAQAQTVGWMDKLFTFRENQKPALKPGKSAEQPRTVIQPHYPTGPHEGWSNYYTRTDLQAQDYFAGSASKVMRPADHRTGGWDVIEDRADLNARQMNTGNVFIGEAGEGPGMAAGGGQVGRETKIGAPTYDWRESNPGGLNSRPGDFDYRGPSGIRPVLEEDGAVKSENLMSSTGKGGTKVAESALRYDKRFASFNDKGDVTGYVVQKGDTLGSIAAMPMIYGKEKRWPLIYSANKKHLKNPHSLKVGQQLVIPRDYTEKQAVEAEKKAD